MDFQREVHQKYKKYKVKKSLLTAPAKDLCRPPSKFKLQPSQAFLESFMGKSSRQKGLLIFHKIGSGKTCTAIRIAESWKHKRKIVAIMPAFLVTNFYNELMSPCTEGAYGAENREEAMERIHEHYTILSYQMFVSKLSHISLKNTLLIIDEVQNIISEEGKFYQAIAQKIARAPDDLRIVLLSATPIFDKPVELALTLNLLPIKEKLPVGTEFDDLFINEDEEGQLHLHNAAVLRKSMAGFVSYYRGMPPQTFPKVGFNIVDCTMSSFQYRSYRAALKEMGSASSSDLARGKGILKLPSSFFLGARITSNVAFPNGQGNERGFESWKGAALTKPNLQKYSIKFYKLLNRIKRTPRGVKIFVYSGFAEYGGIQSLVRVLDANGFSHFNEDDGQKRKYAIWSGKESTKQKDEVRNAFNDPDSGLDLLLGSPAIREGVSLKRVEQVHILEPYWNFSRIFQVLGRASRYCSHADLPVKRRKAEVFLYRAVRPEEKSFKDKNKLLERLSVDRYILRLAKSKQLLVHEFETILKETSIDCLLNSALEDGKVACNAGN